MKEIINSFTQTKELAIAGVSASREKWGNMLYRALTRKGYRVYPVNPGLDEVEGVKCYRKLSDLPAQIENLIIATPPDATEKIVKACPGSGIKRVWMHKGGGAGAQSDEAISFAAENNIEVVYGFCPMMFFPPVGIHKVHLWLRKISGGVPAEFKE